MTELATALGKAKHYCAYQERCHSEVRDKLYSFALHKNEVEQLITHLIEEGFINEERFALAYAGGKFKMKNWGREKIKYALKQKKVSDYCIRKALASINSSEYNRIFIKVAEKKLKELRSEKNVFIKKKKLKNYLLQKGYETRLITEYLKNI